jgi:hypothetical protein
MQRLAWGNTLCLGDFLKSGAYIKPPLCLLVVTYLFPKLDSLENMLLEHCKFGGSPMNLTPQDMVNFLCLNQQENVSRFTIQRCWSTMACTCTCSNWSHLKMSGIWQYRPIKKKKKRTFESSKFSLAIFLWVVHVTCFSVTYAKAFLGSSCLTQYVKKTSGPKCRVTMASG